MAFPPPFPNPLMPRIPPQASHSIPFGGPKFGFFSSQRHHGIIPVPGMPIIRPRFRPPVGFVSREPRPNLNAKPTGPPTTTTVFIGNITNKCPDRVVQEIIKKCGSVCNWKRLQDSSGKFKAFGFCDFMYPDGAKMALNVLKDFPLGDKRLNVKADEQTEKMLEEFAKNKAASSIKDESEDSVKEAIRKIIEEEVPELLDIPVDGQTEIAKEKSPTAESTKSSNKGSRRSHSSSDDSRRHKKSSHRRTAKSPSRKKSRKHSDSSDDTSSVTSYSSRESVKLKHKKSRKKSPSSEDSDEMEERRRSKKELKERNESYKVRLKKWEEREKRMAKHYEKEKEEERQRQKTIQREAKKLRQFLEDYVDERDDPKYYKGTALFQRKRNYEREREADAKDRHEEKRELEEIRKAILEETSSGVEAGGREDLQLLYNEEKEHDQNGETLESPRPSQNEAGRDEKAAWETVGAKKSTSDVQNIKIASPIPVKKTIVTTLQQKTVVPMSKLNGVFQEEEEEVDTIHQIKKKIKPFEITQEDRIQSMTPEERKKLIKDLIARIPTDRAKLFAFGLCWEFIDEVLMEQRIRPWVNKKICDYIGEEEPSLVTFICDKISNKSSADDILRDLSMVLDDEAEKFMVKLWRLIVYESEAKRLGLSNIPSATEANR